MVGQARRISIARKFYVDQDLKPSEIYDLLKALHQEWLLFRMDKTEQEETRRAISLYFRNLKEVRPELRGRDLKDMGITPGPVYREILDGLLDGRLNGELSSSEEEVEFVRKHFMDASNGRGFRIGEGIG